MCGLVAVLDARSDGRSHTAAVQRACDAIAHRGPDDEGAFFDGPVALGFRRLSILDLSPAGHQPMTSQDGAWTLVFNGEIYNFLELRRGLIDAGVQLRSDSDTEVLLELLAREGPQCLSRCNGMWALAAWHAPTKALVLARDPWGIKTLYVSEQNGSITCCSEIKGLRAAGCDLGGVDALEARLFLEHHELDTGERTFFAGVRRLAPGVIERHRVGHPVEQSRAGDGAAPLPAGLGPNASDEAWSEAFREAFLHAVKLRMRADVDAGTSLSGGLDSTAIACATARFLQAERASNCRHAFTVHTPEFDESRYIEPVVQQTGARWHVTTGDAATLQAAFPGFRRAHDQPVHTLTALAGYLVMDLAAQAGVKVLLNGQGSDELLAGYPSSELPWLRSLIRERGAAEAWAQASALRGSRPAGLRMVAQAAAGQALRTLPSAVELALRGGAIQARRGAPPLWAADGPLAATTPPRLPESLDLHRHLLENEHRSPLPTYLRIEDINSSAFSIEARLPFLDPHVVAIARAAPAHILRRGPWNKSLLRQILPGLVPDIVWQRRDKMGFPVPAAAWLRGPLREPFRDVLADPKLKARGWYDVPRLRRERDAFLADAAAGLRPELHRVFLLELWAQDHLD